MTSMRGPSPEASGPTLVDCGCVARAHPDGSGIEIDYCALHEGAADLLAALRDLVEHPYDAEGRNLAALARARAAIAKVQP